MINQISITNYKNYATGKASFVEKLNFITGLNGSGKTNMLDALHYICVTKSFNTGRDRYSLRFEADFFRLEAMVNRSGSQHKVVAKVKPGSIKEFALDNTPLDRLADHVGFQPVIILSPADQIMIEGGSEKRRRFMDFYLCQTSQEYLKALMQYNKLLHQRNALLKDQGYRADKLLLDSYSEGMLAPSTVIMRLRAEFVDEFRPRLIDLNSRVTGDNDNVNITYKPDLQGLDIVGASAASLRDDIRLGRTTRGIHKDDVLFDLGEMLLRRYGSQGQRKSFLITMHLALYEFLREHTGVPPIILLDDIFDKLDDSRVLALLDVLGTEDFGQVFITDARSQRVQDMCGKLKCNSRVFTIEAGTVIKVEDYDIGG